MSPKKLHNVNKLMKPYSTGHSKNENQNHNEISTLHGQGWIYLTKRRKEEGKKEKRKATSVGEKMEKLELSSIADVLKNNADSMESNLAAS